MGHLIPAGTGLKKFGKIILTEEEKVEEKIEEEVSEQVEEEKKES